MHAHAHDAVSQHLHITLIQIRFLDSRAVAMFSHALQTFALLATISSVSATCNPRLYAEHWSVSFFPEAGCSDGSGPKHEPQYGQGAGCFDVGANGYNTESYWAAFDPAAGISGIEYYVYFDCN